MIDNTKKITIAGAGLVGSLQALIMARRGFQVEVYEGREDMRSHDVEAGRSINLALANRGIASLKLAGVMEKVEKFILPMKGRMIHEIGKKQNFLPYGQKPGEIVYSVGRGDLNKLLLDEAEATGKVNFHFKRRIRGVDIPGKSLEVETPGQVSKVNFDFLVGTDGAGSPVRKSLMKVSGSKDNVDWLDHSYKELTIPPSAEGEFKLAKEALHIWPRGEFMIIALPNPDKSFTVTLFMPTHGPVSFESLDTFETVTNFFAEYFPSIEGLIPDVVKMFLSNKTGPLGTIKCYPWIYEDSVCLMGDAAHAIVPFHGQGMNCGFEDCMDFDRILEHSSSWEGLLQEYQRARKVNGDAIADLALDNYIVMRSSVRDEKFLAKKEIGFELERNFPEKFIPRYSRVMFHHTPYSDALRLGSIQDKILEELYANFKITGHVDLEHAASLIKTNLG